MNKVFLIGNLAHDPERKGSACQLVVATNEYGGKDENGKVKTKAEFHRVVAFNKTGENCEKYLSKGDKVGVEGRLETSVWQDKDGAKRQTTKILANNVEFLNVKQKSEKENNTSEEDDGMPF